MACIESAKEDTANRLSSTNNLSIRSASLLLDRLLFVICETIHAIYPWTYPAERSTRRFRSWLDAYGFLKGSPVGESGLHVWNHWFRFGGNLVPAASYCLNGNKQYMDDRHRWGASNFPVDSAP
jgi:hypothetical protein